jgi:peptide/nickel transport system permease protein
MSLLSYIIRRAIILVILLFAVANFNFLLFEFIPMGIFGLGASFFVPCKGFSCTNGVIYQNVINEFHLNAPWPQRWATYIVNTFTFQFGNCIGTNCGNKPVWLIIEQYAPQSIFLLGISTILAILIGTFLGLISASRRGKFIDLTNLSTSIFAFSIPSFWIGLIMIYFFTIANPWFPHSLGQATIGTSGIQYIQGYLWAATLPIIVLTIISYGLFLLIMRNTTYDILDEDYIIMARAKGLSERKVLYSHAFRNALLPVVTGIALAFGGILGGAVITEQIFNFTGIGYYLLQAIFAYDFPTLQGIFFLIAVMTVVANFIADIAYGFLDPRITY